MKFWTFIRRVFVQEQRDLPPVDVDDMDFDCWEDR